MCRKTKTQTNKRDYNTFAPKAHACWSLQFKILNLILFKKKNTEFDSDPGKICYASVTSFCVAITVCIGYLLHDLCQKAPKSNLLS